MSEKARAKVLSTYCPGLRNYPIWAIEKAFTDWAKTGRHRPAPADLIDLAAKAIRPLMHEIKHRAECEKASADDLPDRTPEEKARAQALVDGAGYNPKRFRAGRHQTGDDNATDDEQPKRRIHWTEAAAPGSAEIAELNRERDGNKLIQQARAARERKARQ